jgi:hypothetical protein
MNSLTGVARRDNSAPADSSSVSRIRGAHHISPATTETGEPLDRRLTDGTAPYR